LGLGVWGHWEAAARPHIQARDESVACACLYNVSMSAPGASFIRDVWAENLESEFATIREVIVNYPYVSMDTEFPGVVARPIGNFKSSSDFHYQSVRCNVDLLKIIQFGLTLCNEEGDLAPNVCTYQFNFKFSLNDDIYAQDSIDLLTRSGIDFSRHEEGGIDPTHFAELMMCSGIVLCEEVRWVTFHSGYDFAYILKLLTCKPLPTEEEDFFRRAAPLLPAHLRHQAHDALV